MLDVNKLVDEFRDYIRLAVQPLHDRIAVLEAAAARVPEKGDKGDPGTGLAGAVVSREGDLVVTLSNGAVSNLGPVCGSDGADGFSLDEFEAEYDGERTITLRFAAAGRAKEYAFEMPVVLHRGFWREGKRASAGDAYTHDGSLWIAKQATTSTPTHRSEHWQLAVRKGNDGARTTAAPAPREVLKLKGRANA